MKFQNGCWLMREGCQCFSPKQVYEMKYEEGAVILCAPTGRIQTKGDTLGGINLTLRITAPMPEVIRVQTWHHMGLRKRTPEFELNLPDTGALSCCQEGNHLVITSGTLKLVIDTEDFSMRYERDGELLTRSVGGDLGYLKTNWTGFAYDRGPDNAYLRQQLSLGVGELVYGLGEHFTPFVKNGQSIAIWNEDGGTSTEQAYKNIPFYLTNKGYGVFVNHPERVEFEIGSEAVNKVGFCVKGEHLDYFVINGPTMKDVLVRYTDLTGKPAMPARWTYGLWLSTSFTTDYDEKTVMRFIDGMLERDIPLSVFHFDCCWMREFHWSDFTWDSRVFPNPKGMLTRIKEKGVKICVWINSYIAQESRLFREGVEKGYFLKRPNGDVWQWDMWQPGMALVDFTNPAASKWFQDQLEALLDMGVDCFKTDFGERIPTDCVYFDGSDPEKMHNYYTYLYNKAVYELLVRKKGREEALLFARSATAGGQKFPVHWGGDCWSDYESMEQSLRGGLSLTSSGFGFWSHDIGGFESRSTADVYKRWCAFGLLSTHSRLHGSSSYRVPWLYDDEAVDVLRFFTKLKLSLLPYLYTSGAMTSITGIPMMRSLILEFPEDRNVAYLDKEYMLGESLLAAPIFNEKGMAEYYLPAGTWTNYLTGEQTQGGVWRKEHHDYCSIPLWVRENAIVPASRTCRTVSEPYAQDLEFRVYTLRDTASSTVWQDGKEIAALQLTRGEQGICGTYWGPEARVRLVNCKAIHVQGAEAEYEGDDTLLTVCGDFSYGIS